MDQPTFAINPSLDPEKLARDFAATGRIHVPDFLAGRGADQLFDHIRKREDWHLVINQEDKVFELDRAAQAALSEQQKTDLDVAVYRGARRGFQFRYETIRVPDADADRTADGRLLSLFAQFLSSSPAIDFLRTLTGSEDVAFADAQATAYGPNHFLTAHHDEVQGKNRRAAYVFNLTPEWSADWGGLLMFHAGDGHIDHAFTPRFNALNIFRVPQPHSVSCVVPYVPHRRYAVTGWLRTGDRN